MEIGLDAEIPTYSGGLGMLAGDTIRSAADLKIPMVAVSLLHRKGYFYQQFDPSGWQTEQPVAWVVEDLLQELPARAAVTIEGRTVQLRCWKYEVHGVSDHTVPVLLLDADLEENAEWDRTLTDYLYGGDKHYRLCQEIILGIGGVRMLRALEYDGIARFHMNEGHASLLTLELLDEHAQRAGRKKVTRDDIDAVRKQCVFTTHTPVPAGHDQFPMDLVNRVLGPRQEVVSMKDIFCHGDLLNTTYLALNLSHYVNGVAKKHGEVSRLMFARYAIDSITNGVHAATWAAQPLQEVFDRHIPGWRGDNFSLRYALSIPQDELWAAHRLAKDALLRQINKQTNIGLDLNLFTIGFARRVATYKRADILFSDIERLKQIAAKAGAFQLIYAGKAHPHDTEAKEIIKRIFQMKEILKDTIKVVYIPNYDMDLGRMITAGVDLWLNTPQPPLEASGTSGMKAAINGVPSFSILDGWWIEGCIEGLTGWAIGAGSNTEGERENHGTDISSMYEKLEQKIIPMFYHDRNKWIDVMRHAIALNGSFFNTQRMVQQYVVKAYFE